ncbi:MAG: transketolase family protein [Phycisphaerae bacterium]|nr:transketolase family protein [Phycisphaerae bacterium]
MAEGLTWTIADADHMTAREIYGEVLTQIGMQRPDIVAMTADLAGSTKIGTFQKKFPERFFNVGIQEPNMFSLASGMAAAGLTPVVSTFAVFTSLRSAEQVRTDIDYQKRNVKIIATHGGTSFGQAGTTHHCTEDIAIMRSFANMTVIVPADGYETAKAVTAAVEMDGPVYIRIGRGFEPPVYDSMDYDFEIGKAIEMHEGTDITLIACGVTVLQAVEAAKFLQENSGLSVRVLNMHTIKPLDEEAVMKAVMDTRRIVTVEDHNTNGGLGTAVADVIAASGKGCAFTKVGIPGIYAIVGYPDDLLAHYKMDANGLIETVNQIMRRDFEEDEDWEDEA